MRPTPAGTDVLPLLLRDLDPDGATARQWLTDELARPEYHQGPNPLQAVLGWLADGLGSLFGTVGGGSGGSMSILGAVLAVALVVAVLAMLLRVRGDRGRVGRTRPGVLPQGEVTPAQWRTIADEAYAEARYGDAVVAWFRALAREAADRTLLGPSAGLTAHEVALRLAPLFPDHAAALARSGDVFDVVLYGKLQVGRAEAEEVRDLDAALRSARPRSLPDLVGVAS